MMIRTYDKTIYHTHIKFHGLTFRGLTEGRFVSVLTLRNANATSVAIYTCKSSNCNSALVVASITMRSPLNNFIIIAHKVVLTAKTSDKV